MKSLISIVLLLLSLNANSATIEYRIVFTQTFFQTNVGARNIDGSFFVDDSILGTGFENMSYGPYSSEIDYLTNFTATLDSPNYKGGGIYDFDLPFTRAIVSPPISTVLLTGSSGELIDIQGGLTTTEAFSQIILGREGNEGTYVDVQKITSTSALVVSSGTYVIERVSPIPIPSAVWLFGSGLIGLIGLSRRKSN